MCKREMTLGEEIIGLSTRGIDTPTVERMYRKYIEMAADKESKEAMRAYCINDELAVKEFVNAIFGVPAKEIRKMVNNSVKVVGQIRLGSSVLDVYGDLDEPLFKAADIANIIEYSYGNTWRMLDMCEADEKLNLPMVVAGQRRTVSFVNEHGLYSILSQSRKEIARAWRRVVHDELINLRRTKNLDISEQFDKWNNAMDNIYFDEATGQLMQSITTPGGDVEQIPYKG